MVASRSLKDRARRRGVTLLELMVVVALLVLIMTILAEIFRSATGALTSQQAYAVLDQDLRRADTIIRQDLAGTTAKMTPPNNPTEKTGYFTYGENAPADTQGEDGDDYIAFTAKAPAGRPFMGYMTVPVRSLTSGTLSPITSTSNPPSVPAPVTGFFNRIPITSDYAEVIYFLRNGNLYRRVFLILPPDRQSSLSLGTSSGGAGVTVNPGGGYATNSPNMNPSTGLFSVPMSWISMNDISARPSRYQVGSFIQVPTLNTLGDLTNRENRAFSPRFTDDYHYGAAAPLDGVPDDLNGDGLRDFYPTLYPQVLSNPALMNPANAAPSRNGIVSSNPQVLSFPYIYPNAYSASNPSPATVGSIHNLMSTSGNHAPLDLGDPLTSAPYTTGQQTWWGFPTKKEQMSIFWTDPVKRINDINQPGLVPGMGAVGQQSLGLQPAFLMPAWTVSNPNALLPPITTSWRHLTEDPVYGDGAGGPSFVTPMPPYTAAPLNALWQEAWKALPEEDLLLTNVRSFDVKGLDPLTQQYSDLGYLNSLAGTTALQLFSLGHEGRIPPIVNDFRSDPQWPSLLPNIGDNTPSVVRLRRVWDSWSTDYSYVPSLTLSPLNAPPFAKPAYPSYPPPYPVPLRGIQIQIRVVDPTNQRIKIHTIRQDFSNKL